MSSKIIDTERLICEVEKRMGCVSRKYVNRDAFESVPDFEGFNKEKQKDYGK